MSEISALAALLGKYDIPFTLYPFTLGEENTIQICSPDKDNCRIDAVSHWFSYGGKDGLIEIMAHNDYESVTYNDIIGWLSAKEALPFFQKVWGK